MQYRLFLALKFICKKRNTIKQKPLKFQAGYYLSQLTKNKIKYLIPVFLFVSFLFIETGCKKVIDDVIDCSLESTLLSIDAKIDTSNTKLVYFEFINDNTTGDFTLDQQIDWNFGDGKTATSTNNKVEHTCTYATDFKVTANYTLHKGSASCTGQKEKTVTIK